MTRLESSAIIEAAAAVVAKAPPAPAVADDAAAAAGTRLALLRAEIIAVVAVAAGTRCSISGARSWLNRRGCTSVMTKFLNEKRANTLAASRASLET